ncbi:ATP-binding protein [Amycolatopsis sp. NPDC059657]|uniref:ATP-binding protein n=1 Tax=Amycolatopsis sp. NPDC059657 TaxID=3346899 RepID=UPI0036729AB8
MAPHWNGRVQDPRPPVRPGNAFDVRLPAEPRQLALLRTVTEGVAERAGFAPDGIADLKMAVDEACSLLITVASPLEALRCRFRTLGGEVRVTVTAPTLWAADTTSFGWRMLKTLAGSLFANLSPPLARIEFTQHASS